MSEDEIILTHILKCRRIDLLVDKPTLTVPQHKQFHEYKARRLKGEPLQYILGCWEFYGLMFKVDPRVLVPRPETEILVDLAIRNFKSKDILDLGTGSGNIAITLAKFLPHAQIVTVDISQYALVLAKDNAHQHGVEERVEFVHTDIGEYCRTSACSFDLIISNPPYVPSGQMNQLPIDVRQEPAIALDGGSDGLDFYRTIIKYSPRLLRTGACLMMESGDGQAEAIGALFKTQPLFLNIEIHKDLAGKDRIIIAGGFDGKICH
ncbi:MAG: peptide chain release factor N(5)-glutamine methyltransferase [Candidatus Omnitrophica bacterium]|nr:peptide chain release factor N(5)-glutamine methyltransferase [Candidatus Omnitrophota bacterium]